MADVPPRSRLRFVDALRGLAVVLMVVNHTARWWLEPSVGGARDVLIYVTMVLAGPTFLLLVGFSLALAFHRATVIEGRTFASVVAAALWRAAGIALAGFLLNLVVFPQDVLAARVLQSIALALVVATPLLPLVRRRAGRGVLLVVAVGLYAAFPGAVPALGQWSRVHPVAGSLLFREFPLFPWLGLVLVGMVMGWWEATAPDPRRQDRRYSTIGLAGLAGLAAYLFLDRTTPLAARLAVGRDLALNDYWTAGPVTAVGMAAALLCLVALAFWIVERARRPLEGLVLFGRAALMLYVVHLIIVIPVVREAGGVALRDWASYGVATGLLLVCLAALARAWIQVRGPLARWRRLLLRPACEGERMGGAGSL